MPEWKTALTTVVLFLIALAAWELFLRKPVAGLLTKGDDVPAGE